MLDTGHEFMYVCVPRESTCVLHHCRCRPGVGTGERDQVSVSPITPIFFQPLPFAMDVVRPPTPMPVQSHLETSITWLVFPGRLQGLSLPYLPPPCTVRGMLRGRPRYSMRAANSEVHPFGVVLTRVYRIAYTSAEVKSETTWLSRAPRSQGLGPTRRRFVVNIDLIP